jgi:acyl carrier protein
MKKSDFLRAFEEALELDAGTISGTETFQEVEWWDSMAALVFISLADEKAGVMVTGAQLQQCRGVPDLLGLLGDKLAA